MQKIIYISGSPIGTTYGGKLGVEWFSSNNIKVEYWNLTCIYFKKNRVESYFNNSSSYRYKFPVETEINHKAEFRALCKKLPSSSIFCFIDFSFLDYFWILRLFNKYNINYFTHPMSTPFFLSKYSRRSFYRRVIDSFKGKRFLYNCIKIFSNQNVNLKKILYEKTDYYKKPNFSMGSGIDGVKYWSKVTQAKLFINVPTTDVNWSSLPPLIQGKYYVYVDEGITKSADASLFGLDSHGVFLNQSLFLKNLNNVFDIIEEHMKIPVVIAATARCKYSNSSIFNNRKIVYDETFSLIQNSELVIGHKSQALFQAVASNKPILILRDENFINIKNAHIFGMSDILNIDSISTENFSINFLDLLLNREQKYQSIVEKYLCNISDCNLDWRELALNQIKKTKRPI
jgi:hypothetical protein